MKNKYIVSGVVFAVATAMVLPNFSVKNANAREVDEKGPLSKITFVHYKKNGAIKSSVKNTGGSACYGFISSGAKWKTTEDYIVNPTNSGVDSALVSSDLSLGVDEWERYGGNAIFGNQIVDINAFIVENSTDGKNVVTFGPIADTNTIAVTTIWGYFGGAARTRQIVEWDMKFNTVFHWGDATIDPTVMDIRNIATHELGHSAGMKDLYTTSCSAQTMYGYSDEGDIVKRDLASGDIFGIQSLY
jgi:hypothetical protein